MGKKVKKLIPKEIKPALPFVAAAFGAPYLAGSSFMTSAISNPFVRNLVAKGITSAATSKATGADTKQALRSGILAAAPDVLAKGLGSAGRVLGDIRPESKLAQTLVSKGTGLETTLAKPGLDMATAKVIGGQTAIEAGQRAIELNEKALRDYEAQLREQGIMDSSERRNKIFGYFTRAGYGAEETNAMLDKYGYKKGGRVEKADLKGFGEKYIEFMKEREKAANGGRIGFDRGGRSRDPRTAVLVSSLLEKGMKLEDALSLVDEEYPEEFNYSSLMSGLEGLMSGYQTATGQPLMGSKPQPTRFGLAEGGIPMTQNARKTIKELIEAGMLEDEGEGILDLIRKNPDMIGGPIMPVRPETFDLESYKTKVNNLPMFIEMFIDDFRQENGRNPTPEEIKMYAQKVTPTGFADGGMLNTGGREMDMRGGGFIPIGAKERADDVPARLSKNEFVMTADAVRAAGGGSINKGAKRMYDLMNKLESKV